MMRILALGPIASTSSCNIDSNQQFHVAVGHPSLPFPLLRCCMERPGPRDALPEMDFSRAPGANALFVPSVAAVVFAVFRNACHSIWALLAVLLDWPASVNCLP